MKIQELTQKKILKKLINTTVFFSIFALLFVVNIFGSFRGMNSPEAMEAASLGREIVRGNGLQNKVIYPLSIAKSSEREKPIALLDHTNTHLGPVYPYVNAAFLALVEGGDFDAYKIPPGSYVYALDRVLAGACMLFFMISIGLNYYLAKKLFDAKIALTLALIMLLSNFMWDYVQSCLPQMFLLMIFSFIQILFYQAHLLFKQTGKTPWFPLIGCALLFGIMALTKWLTLWIFLGYLAAVLFHFRPRGLISITSLGIVLVMIVPVILVNYNSYGNPLGLAGASIANSLANSEQLMLRNYGSINLRIEGLILNMVKLCFLQCIDLTRHLAGLIVAPLFFLSLLHTYRRPVTNQFKWALLTMWIPAVIGMAIFGGRELLEQHSLHILFAPSTAMMGISVVSIMWSKLEISNSKTIFAHSHLYLIVLICAGPLLSDLPRQILYTFRFEGKGLPNAPFYQTAELSNELHEMVGHEGASQVPIIYSDQPAATAWYSDVHSIAIPNSAEQINSIEAFAKKQNIVISGIHTSAYSTQHAYLNPFNGVAPLVHLPILKQITGITLDPRRATPDLKMLGDNAYPRDQWRPLAKTYPHSKYIRSSSRNEFKDFGLHIFHSRIKTIPKIEK